MAPPFVFLVLLLAQVQGPRYEAAGLVNSASGWPQFSANTIVTLYGESLSNVTASLRPGANPPLELGGVRILIDLEPAEMLYVSPTQVNFRMGPRISRSTMNLTLARDGRTGPSLNLPLRPEAPELYAKANGELIATFADGSLITAEKPARPGSVVILYGTGFGLTQRPTNGLAFAADSVADPGRFEIRLEGVLLERGLIHYIGLTPGFAGLFQVNLTIPAGTVRHPEIRIRTPAHESRPDVRLPFLPD